MPRKTCKEIKQIIKDMQKRSARMAMYVAKTKGDYSSAKKIGICDGRYNKTSSLDV